MQEFPTLKLQTARKHGITTLACLLCAALVLAGCSGSSTFSKPQAMISVSLVPQQVTVSQDGTPVTVSILIDSPSETALVAVTGLPKGCEVKYSASDTSPSGILTFTANATSPVGSYMPVVNVNSANQTASTQFTFTVKAASSGM